MKKKPKPFPQKVLTFMSHCSPAQIHLVNIPSCIISFPLRWEGGEWGKGSQLYYCCWQGCHGKQSSKKQQRTKNVRSACSLRTSPWPLSLFLHSTSGKTSSCKHLQLSHQQGWNQPGGHRPFLFRQTSCSWQNSAKVFNKSWAAASA